METAENKYSTERAEQYTSYILVMIKPHAINEGSDVILSEIFDGNIDRHVPYLSLGQQTQDNLRRIKVASIFYRLLDDKRYFPVLDVFYGAEKGKRHYPFLIEEYRHGTSGFLLLTSSLPVDILYQTIQTAKGLETLINVNDQVERKGAGIRGILKIPTFKIDIAAITDEQIIAITKNVIHVSDTEEQSRNALKILLSSSESENIGLRFPTFVRFLNRYE